MELITKESDLLANIETLKQYLKDSGIDRDFALDLVRLGICFVITEENGNPFFAPSRFVGYRSNTRHDHSNNNDKDGRETNAALEAFLGSAPTPSETLEREYEQFCAALGIQVRNAPFGIARKFLGLAAKRRLTSRIWTPPACRERRQGGGVLTAAVSPASG